MPITYLDRVLYLHPDIQGVMYWHTNPDTGQTWDNPYDGLAWENQQIPKPTQAELDALDESEVEQAIDVRTTAALQDRITQAEQEIAAIRQSLST